MRSQVISRCKQYQVVKALQSNPRRLKLILRNRGRSLLFYLNHAWLCSVPRKAGASSSASLWPLNGQTYRSGLCTTPNSVWEESGRLGWRINGAHFLERPGWRWGEGMGGRGEGMLTLNPRLTTRLQWFPNAKFPELPPLHILASRIEV